MYNYKNPGIMRNSKAIGLSKSAINKDSQDHQEPAKPTINKKWKNEEEWRNYVSSKYSGRSKETQQNHDFHKIGGPFIEDLKASISACVKNSEALLIEGARNNDAAHFLAVSSVSKGNQFLSSNNTFSEGFSNTKNPAKLHLSESKVKFNKNGEANEQLFLGILDRIKNASGPSTATKSTESRYSRIRRSLDERFKGKEISLSRSSFSKEIPWTRANSLKKNSSSKVQERLDFLETKISSIREKFTQASRSCFRDPQHISEFKVSPPSAKSNKISGVKLVFEETRYTKRKDIEDGLKEKIRQLKAVSKPTPVKEGKENYPSTISTSDSQTLLRKAQEYISLASSKLTNSKLNNEQPKISNSSNAVTDELYYYSHILKLLFSSNRPNSTTYSNLIQEHFHLSFQILSHASSTLLPPRFQELKKIHLPYSSKPTLILDMDETLLHCSTGEIDGADAILDLRIPGSEPCKVSVFLRPFLYEALEELNKEFELVVFTASHAAYANLVLDFVDAPRKFIKHRIFRDYCVLATDGMFVKDLRILVNRELDDILIVDNSAHCFIFQPSHGVPIVPFYYDQGDSELKALAKYLKKISGIVKERNISHREANNEELRMSRYDKYGSSIEFLENEFESVIKTY